MMSIAPLCAMENERNNVISDADLLAKKKAFALKWIEKKTWERETLVYPRKSDIVIDLDTLNKELGLSFPESIYKIGDRRFIVPKGMDSSWIHPTLIPERVSDSEVEQI